MRTEDDLRSALAALARTASPAEDGLERPAVPSMIQPQRRTKKWPAALAVAAAVAAVAVAIALPLASHRAQPGPAGTVASAAAATTTVRLTSAPPTIKNSAPPTIKNSAPPTIKNSAPPPTKSSASATTASSAPPRTNNSTSVRSDPNVIIAFRFANGIVCGSSIGVLTCTAGVPEFNVPECHEYQPGFTISMRATGVAGTSNCAGDIMVPFLHAKVGPYDTPINLGVATCTVNATKGVTCTNSAGHGFTLSRASHREF